MDRIIVMGASQGGIAALRTIIRGLPKTFEAPVLVVQHLGAESILPSVLNDVGGLPVVYAKDGDPIRGGRILVAPPEQHMLVSDGRIELTRGPRENWSRPALDPLFRTAAAAYGEAVVGVVLTGRLNDGAAGLYEIKRMGGIAIVQDPADAEAPSMPQSAIAAVPVDFRLPVREIAPCLIKLAEEARSATPARRTEPAMDPQKRSLTPPLAQTCPECGGAMREEALGPLTRFRCHIGHIMTAEVLVAAQTLVLENQLASTLRLLNERAALCREMADKAGARGEAEARAAWLRAGDEAARREEILKALTETEWTHPENVLEPAD
jgi:two-component system chemotaxis response regulator CheB